MKFCPDTLERLHLLIRKLKVANAKEYRYRMLLEEKAWTEPRDIKRAEIIRQEQQEFIQEDVTEIKELIKQLGL